MNRLPLFLCACVVLSSGQMLPAQQKAPDAAPAGKTPAAAPAGAASAGSSIRFEDMTAKLGITDLMKGWTLGHGACIGDADGDGRPDFYIGAFSTAATFGGPDANYPCLLLLNKPNGFVLPEDKTVLFKGQLSRLSGCIFVDLDNDGDLDLVAGMHVHKPVDIPTKLFENLGGGKFKDVTPQEKYWPSDRGIRNIGALDLNDDGLLDIIMADGSYGRTVKKVHVLENKGNFKFEDASAKYGFPQEDIMGLGLAFGDVNNDDRMDVFVVGHNRMFISGKDGKYHEIQRGLFVLPPRGNEALACGGSFADLNGDGLLDLITTEHAAPSHIHIYLNEGIKDGDPHFVQITDKAGVGDAFHIKTTQVKLEDIDNDGRVDILLANIVKDEQGVIQPLVLRNLGNKDGIPQFSRPADSSVVGYYAAAPIGDYDLDGRVDIFMVPYFTRTPPYLFRNVTAGGHQLTVKVVGKGPGMNPMGIGSIVRAYKPGMIGKADGLIGRYDIVIGTGYSTGDVAIAHLGLGENKTVDLEVSWGQKRVTRTAVPADQNLTIEVEGK